MTRCCRISKKKRFNLAESCSSASIIGANDDLLTEILVLLPTKSVVRFKSVSKHWLFLISTESFTRLHVQNHGRRHGETQHSLILNDVHGRPQFFICHPTKKKLVRVSLPRPINSNKWRVTILQSMNGLLLLSLEKDQQIDYVVFNPTTKQYRVINLEGYQPSRVCLFFDPLKSEYYKLVMSSTNTNVNPRFSVYDSATHQWSHGKDSPFNGDIILHNHIVCSLILQDTRHNNLLGIPEIGAYHSYMFESNEHLNILQLTPFRRGENKRCFRVGVIKDDNWVICKKATLDFDNDVVGLLGMIREESIEDSIFLFHVPGRLLIYKFSTGQNLEVLVDYRNDYFYVEDQLQFNFALPLTRSFAFV